MTSMQSMLFTLLVVVPMISCMVPRYQHTKVGQPVTLNQTENVSRISYLYQNLNCTCAAHYNLSARELLIPGGDVQLKPVQVVPGDL